MQIVIDIPEKTYKELKAVTVTHAGEQFAQRLIRYIVRGTPLPKGHKRLIEDEFITVTDIREDGSEFTYVPYHEIEDAQTIIPESEEV